ncbi:MAG TPA: SpoIIE family protein phosphatase [Solirubrobacteraceae bacterium]|jgi:serine phosphatase RsbU (regulator of sigma subunit)/anti-sigma regulatory factor (Ser/Thr protein kinase)|nr:SpoIIE family protein phosphatase [Solirubrobacteraceae bacterium]
MSSERAGDSDSPNPGSAPAKPAEAELGRSLERMLSVTDAALGYLSLEAMISELLERIRDGLRADTAAVLLLDEDRGVLVARAARGLEEEVRQGVQVPLARGFAGRIAAERRPVVIEDLSKADVVNPILRQRGIRSMLGVPVHVEGRVIGVMHVGTLQQRLFDEDDIALLQLAADRAALAIDSARLTEQRSVTEIMQRALLPDALPSIPGLRFSAKYLPGGSGVKVGGDWYDVFQLPSGRLGFVIGDVVGRGVLAASVMAEIRAALRAYLTEGHPLPDVMRLLNELFVAMGRHRSATVAILELDFERGTLEAVSAGHLPPLLVAPGGEASYLELVQGLPLGIRRGGEYASRIYTFDVDSTLLLYTDGLVERRGESIDEGLDHLRAAARRAARAEDASFADRVYRAMLTDVPLEDDVALLAIESLPLGRQIEVTLDAQPGVLAGLRSTLGRWLLSEGVGAEDLFNITLAASEAAANSIEHAYGALEATFRVACVHEGDEIRVTVSDDGRWRSSRPYGRGRGLAIMRALVDDAEIDRRRDGTSVTLIKRLGGRGPA